MPLGSPSTAGQVRNQPVALANTTSVYMVRLLLDVAVTTGISEPDLENILGVDRARLSGKRTRLPSADLYRLMDILQETAGREAGIRAAGTAEFGRLHVWDYMFSSAPTLAEGFADAARFSSAICDPSVALDVVADGALLTVTHTGIPTSEQVDVIKNEFSVAIAIRRAREAFGQEGTPVRVSFTHRAPAHTDYLVKALGTNNIHFDQASDTITFLNREGEGRTSGYDPQLREIMHFYAQEMIDGAQLVPTWLESFRAGLRGLMSGPTVHDVTVDAVAHRLAMSGRTLQRRLTEHGTSWRAELETARHGLAVALLSVSDLSIQSIACQLGYRDRRTLARAFEQWTGQSPTAYRRSLTRRPEIKG